MPPSPDIPQPKATDIKSGGTDKLPTLPQYESIEALMAALMEKKRGATTPKKEKDPEIVSNTMVGVYLDSTANNNPEVIPIDTIDTPKDANDVLTDLKKQKQEEELSKVYSKIEELDTNITNVTGVADNLLTSNDEARNANIIAKDTQSTIEAQKNELKEKIFKNKEYQETLAGVGINSVDDFINSEEYQKTSKEVVEIKKLETKLLSETTLATEKQNKLLESLESSKNFILNDPNIDPQKLPKLDTQEQIVEALSNKISNLTVERYSLFLKTPKGKDFLKTPEGQKFIKSKEGNQAAKKFIIESINEAMSSFDPSKDNPKNLKLIKDQFFDIEEIQWNDNLNVRSICDDAIRTNLANFNRIQQEKRLPTLNHETFDSTTNVFYYQLNDRKADLLLEANPEIAAKIQEWATFDILGGHYTKPDYTLSSFVLEAPGGHRLENEKLEQAKNDIDNYVKINVDKDNNASIDATLLQEAYKGALDNSDENNPNFIMHKLKLVRNTEEKYKQEMAKIEKQGNGFRGSNIPIKEQKIKDLQDKINANDEEEKTIRQERTNIVNMYDFLFSKEQGKDAQELFNALTKVDVNHLVVEPSLNGMGFFKFLETVSERYNQVLESYKPQIELSKKVNELRNYRDKYR